MRPFDDTVVLFDWNGTLVDDTARALDAANAVLRRCGLSPLDPPGFTAVWRLPLTAFFRTLGVGKDRVDDAVAEWNAYVASVPATPRPGADLLLRALRAGGARLGVVSAADASAVSADLHRYGWREYFDVVVTGAADKVVPLRAERYGRRRAAFVGDTEHDIVAALGADYLAVGVAGGYLPASRLLDAGAHTVLEDLTLLPNLLHEVS